MPAHEHLQNQLFTGQGSVDAQRRKRLLAKSQQAIEDIDFAVDNKPYPKNEALEASDRKRWGPDPDPIDPANPTIFRFRNGFNPEINDKFYRTAEQKGTHAEVYLGPSDRVERIDVFGSTSPGGYLAKQQWSFHKRGKTDGPLHGLAQPIYQGTDIHEQGQDVTPLYMSKQEQADFRQKYSVEKWWRRDDEILHHRLYGSD